MLNSPCDLAAGKRGSLQQGRRADAAAYATHFRCETCVASLLAPIDAFACQHRLVHSLHVVALCKVAPLLYICFVILLHSRDRDSTLDVSNLSIRPHRALQLAADFVERETHASSFHQR